MHTFKFSIGSHIFFKGNQFTDYSFEGIELMDFSNINIRYSQNIKKILYFDPTTIIYYLVHIIFKNLVRLILYGRKKNSDKSRFPIKYQLICIDKKQLVV